MQCHARALTYVASGVYTLASIIVLIKNALTLVQECRQRVKVLVLRRYDEWSVAQALSRVRVPFGVQKLRH